VEDRGKPSIAQVFLLLSDSARVRSRLWSGTTIERIRNTVARTVGRFNMGVLKKTLKAGIIAGVCGLGLCALARKLNLPMRIAELAHSVEAVPFPGTKLYSFLAAKQLRPLYAAIAEEITSAEHFERILDLGTGPGYLPIELALRNPSACISGIDESPDMIQIANANAHASRVTKSVEFSTGDPTDLPFPGRYFDLVVSVNVLHHWREPLAVFEEVFHILVPGGQFRIYDYRKDVPSEAWESLRSKLSFVPRTALLFGPIASSRAAYGKDDLLKMAEQTHFERPEVEEVTLPLFGHPMPAFNSLKLHKPEQNRED